MTVRLAAWEGAERVELRTPADAPVIVDRVGASVRTTLRALADATGARLRLPAPGDGGRWTLGERRYRGTFEFQLRAGGGLHVSNVVPLEDYVLGVVASELAVWSALPAELEAQAIAARTYALRALADRPTGAAWLWDDVHDQAYRGVPDLEGSAAQRAVLARVADAVRATRGAVLVQDGRLFDARYSAACGGRSARLLDVFPKAAPFVYPASSCAPCVRIAADENAFGAAGDLARTRGLESGARARPLGRARARPGSRCAHRIPATGAHRRGRALAGGRGARRSRPAPRELRGVARAARAPASSPARASCARRRPRAHRSPPA